MKLRTWLKLAAAAGGLMWVQSALRRKRTIELAGKVVVVTGGSRGLGLVLARSLVDQGARVAICARDADELARARLDLEQSGGEVFSAVCDVTDRDDVMRFIASVEDDFGAVDVLINNAGIIQVGPLEMMTEEDFEQALSVNLRGPLHAALAVLPGMRKRRAGRIVNIASIGGKLALPHMAPYVMSKFGLVGLSEAMRAELVKDGIYVTTVCPGLMRTGSPRHAKLKGNHQAEYAWFSIGDSLAATSVSAEHAARRIIRGFTQGEPEVVISPQAKLAAMLHGIAPGWVQEVMSVIAHIMPGPTSNRGAIDGKDAESVFSPSVLTRRSDEAARRNNQH